MRLNHCMSVAPSDFHSSLEQHIIDLNSSSHPILGNTVYYNYSNPQKSTFGVVATCASPSRHNYLLFLTAIRQKSNTMPWQPSTSDSKLGQLVTRSYHSSYTYSHNTNQHRAFSLQNQCILHLAIT